MCTFVHVSLDAVPLDLEPLDLTSGPLSCWTATCSTVPPPTSALQNPDQSVQLPGSLSRRTQHTKGTSGVVANCIRLLSSSYQCSAPCTCLQAVLNYPRNHLLAPSHSTGVVAAPCMWDSLPIGVAVAP